MEEAIAAVAGGLMSVREAARKHGVARTTLQRKLSRMAGGSSALQAASPTPEAAPTSSSSSSLLAVAGDTDERGAAAQLGKMAARETFKRESRGGDDGASYSSGTSSPSDADYAQEQTSLSRKRSAEQMERSSLSKGVWGGRGRGGGEMVA
jgi:transposase-like protein